MPVLHGLVLIFAEKSRQTSTFGVNPGRVKILAM